MIKISFLVNIFLFQIFWLNFFWSTRFFWTQIFWPTLRLKGLPWASMNMNSPISDTYFVVQISQLHEIARCIKVSYTFTFTFRIWDSIWDSITKKKVIFSWIPKRGIYFQIDKSRGKNYILLFYGNVFGYLSAGVYILEFWSSMVVVFILGYPYELK